MRLAVLKMVQHAALDCGMDIETFLNRRRAASARAEIYEQLRERGWSYSQIAREFERHHTTIMHAVGAV